MPRPSRESLKRQRLLSESLSPPRGAPRGLLMHYILHRIALKPSHGYEILQDIESKTEGTWRPGAGSVYPILKNLVARGLIKIESGEGGETRRVYRITPSGLNFLNQKKELFASFGQRLTAIRGLIIDLIDVAHIEGFFLDGSKKQFEFARAMLESKIARLTRSQCEYILKEYALNLERQLAWANQMLRESKSMQLKAG